MIDFWPSFLGLFKEAFEGVPKGLDYTWYVQGHEAIFDAFEKTSASAASKRLGEASSIAAHLFHVKYFLELSNKDAQGIEYESDWEGSWAKQSVTEEEWKALQADLRREYEALLAHLEARPALEERDEMNGCLALLPHAAFHLGAVRTLMRAG